jgi:hypothetical protein
MSQIQQMTTEEKLDVLMKAHELREAGNAAEAQRITLELPVPTYMAKFVKEFFGAETLRKGGYNLSEVEAELGPDWLDK